MKKTANTFRRSSPERCRVLAADREFDAKYGVDTSGKLAVDTLGVDGEAADLGSGYQAIHPGLFKKLIDTLPVACEEYVFIDFGSGKGRALVLATEFQFRRIVGVEFSEQLHVVAEQNLERYQSATGRQLPVDLICMDAVQYTIPDEKLVCYFYHPFEKPLMQRLLSRIQESADQHPRPIFLIFVDVPYDIRLPGFAQIAANSPQELKFSILGRT